MGACLRHCFFCWLQSSCSKLSCWKKLFGLAGLSFAPSTPCPFLCMVFELRGPYFPLGGKGGKWEGINLRPHQWENGLIEIVMRTQSQTNKQMGKRDPTNAIGRFMPTKGPIQCSLMSPRVFILTVMECGSGRKTAFEPCYNMQTVRAPCAE